MINRCLFESLNNFDRKADACNNVLYCVNHFIIMINLLFNLRLVDNYVPHIADHYQLSNNYGEVKLEKKVINVANCLGLLDTTWPIGPRH